MKTLLFFLFVFFYSLYCQDIEILFNHYAYFRDILYLNGNVYVTTDDFLKYNLLTKKLDTVDTGHKTYFKKTPPYIVGSLLTKNFFVYDSLSLRWHKKVFYDKAMYRWFNNYFINKTNKIYYYGNTNISVYKTLPLESINNLFMVNDYIFITATDTTNGNFLDGLWMYKNDTLIYVFDKPRRNFELGTFFITDKIYILWPDYFYPYSRSIIYESNIDTSMLRTGVDITFSQKFVIDSFLVFNYYISKNKIYLFGTGGVYVMENNSIYKLLSMNVYAMDKINDDSLLLGGFGLYLWKNISNSVNLIDNNIDYSLAQNYPNPFNSTTTIEFSLKEESFTQLKIYNILGKEIQTLVSKELNAGKHLYTFDGTYLPSGIYFYKLISKDFVQTKKMIIMK